VEPWWFELRKDELDSVLLVLISILRVLFFLALFFIHRDFPVCFKYFFRSSLSDADDTEGIEASLVSSIAWHSAIGE